MQKSKAIKRCMNMCEAGNGVCFRVGNANSFGFTATWMYKKGNVWYRRVETKDNSYIVEQSFLISDLYNAPTKRCGRMNMLLIA